MNTSERTFWRFECPEHGTAFGVPTMFHVERHCAHCGQILVRVEYVPATTRGAVSTDLAAFQAELTAALSEHGAPAMPSWREAIDYLASSKREAAESSGERWRVPFCPDCGQAGMHAGGCAFFPGQPVVHGNFKWVALAAHEGTQLREALERTAGCEERLRAEVVRLREDVKVARRQAIELDHEVEQLDYENGRLGEALDVAVYFADNLQRVIDHKPVRDLTESRAAFVKAREALDV